MFSCIPTSSPLLFPAFNATLLPEAVQTRDFTDRVDLVYIIIRALARTNTGTGTSWLILVDYSFTLFIYRCFGIPKILSNDQSIFKKKFLPWFYSKNIIIWLHISEEQINYCILKLQVKINCI